MYGSFLVVQWYTYLWNLKVEHLKGFDLWGISYDFTSFCLHNIILTAGTGCIVKCVSYAIGREPTVVGKPHKPMLDVIKSR